MDGKEVGLKAVVVDVELHWGFSSKIPLATAAQPTFKLPPPTTLLGALAYAINYGGPEVEISGNVLKSPAARLFNYIPWITLRTIYPDNPGLLVETLDVNRISLVLGIRAENIAKNPARYFWGVQPHGKIVFPCMEIEVVYLVKNDRVEEIARAAWGIVRIGTRESLASVKGVEVRDLKIIDINELKEKKVRIAHATPLNLINTIHGEPGKNYVEIDLPKYNQRWFEYSLTKNPFELITRYIVPIKELEIEPSSSGAVLIDTRNVNYIVPIDVVRG